MSQAHRNLGSAAETLLLVPHTQPFCDAGTCDCADAIVEILRRWHEDSHPDDPFDICQEQPCRAVRERPEPTSEVTS